MGQPAVAEAHSVALGLGRLALTHLQPQLFL